MKLEMFNLCDGVVTDKVTGIVGHLTHASINMEGDVTYIFQPKGLNKDGNPYERCFIEPCRVEGGNLTFVEIPLELLGKKAADRITTVEGVIIGFTLHQGQCLHVELKRPGFSPKDRMYESLEVDIRNIDLVAIKEAEEEVSKAKTSEETLAEAKKEAKTKPSPLSIGDVIR